jgi:predicted glutamine amidotransferase
MCRILGAVAASPVSLRHELLEAENPFLRIDGDHPSCVRFAEAAHADDGFAAVEDTEARIFNCHLRRATVGGLTEENTHPFCLGPYSFGHNGTITEPFALEERGMPGPEGETDSEVFFNWILHEYDPARPIHSLRAAVRGVMERSPFTGLNFLFSDGERLFAYRLGIHELNWLFDGEKLVVASERYSDDPRWHEVRQDVLLCLDPEAPEEPHAERLAGDEWVARGTMLDREEGVGLTGAERGAFAAERAARLAAAAE